MGNWILVLVGVLLVGSLGSSAVAAEPPFGVKNCVRYGADAPCEQPIVRVPYSREYAYYLYYAALTTFTDQSKLKFRLRHGAPETTRQLRLGDLTQGYANFKWGRSVSINGQHETVWVSLATWDNHDDRAAKLFTRAWLMMWNAELRDPWPVTCPVKYDMEKQQWKPVTQGCVDIDFMSYLAIVNAKDHMTRRNAGGTRDWE